MSSNTTTSLFLRSHIYLKFKKFLKHTVFLRCFSIIWLFCMFLSFSGMKVKTGTTAQSSYSFLFLFAILWTKEKKMCKHSSSWQAKLKPQSFCILQAREGELPRRGSGSISTPARNIQLWHSPTPTLGMAPCVWPDGHTWHCQHSSWLCTPARTCQGWPQSRDGLAKDKKSQRNSGQKALKRLTEKKLY